MRWMIGLFVIGVAGCDEHTHVHEGEPTGSVCPDGNTLTYDTFAADFFADYCTRCHAASLTGDARNDAPDDANFDTLAGLRQHIDHLDIHAAAGPLAVNEEMPPSDPRPTLEERTLLGQWLACGLP